MCIRCGDIFDAAFIARMSSFARQADLSERCQSLLTVIHGEAVLGCSEASKSCGPVHSKQHLPDDNVEDVSAAKRLRRSSSSQTLDDTDKPCNLFNSESNSVQDASATNCYSSLTFQTNDAETSIPVTTHSPYSRGPMFYYCLHQRHLKNVNLPK